ncbi:hypothetical protein ACFQJ7_13620 [Halovenus rubra]|uniref:Uncharacterized protein n=2 Tax=Halovenus rubra TaxID=869890 RepID=A0ACC7DYV3_9EURY|nr:hypothetical protein [Halovenus rubra]
MTGDSGAQWWRRSGTERERLITDAALAPDDGLYVVGWLDENERAGDGFGGFLQRLLPDGTVEWEYCWDETRRPKAVTVTSNGPVVAGASLSGDTDESEEKLPAWLASVTTDGVCRWEQGYPNGDGDTFETVVTTPDGVVAGGRTGRYTKRAPDSWERVYGTSDWLLAADIDDGTERWRESYHGNDCVSLLADGMDSPRYVGGSRVVWIASDGTEKHSQYYYAETGSSDTLDSIAPGQRDGDSVIAGKAWEGSAANQARLLVIDSEGERLLDRATGLPDRSNFGKDAIALDDGYLFSGTTLFDGCALPWLVRFDKSGNPEDASCIVRQSGPTADPELTSVSTTDAGIQEHPDGHPIGGRHAAVDTLVPTQDGLFVVYNEHDQSQSPEHRRSWIGYLS